MSQIRIVKMKFDLEKAKRVADKLGWSYTDTTVIYDLPGFTSVEVDLALIAKQVQHGMSSFKYELGIKDGQLIFDDVYRSFATKFTKAYVEDLLQERCMSYNVVETTNKVVITIGG